MADPTSQQANGNKNPTDPIVVFDPEYDRSYIVKSYVGTETSAEERIDAPNSPDQTRFDAIYIPLVKINSMEISDDAVRSVEIKIHDFLPTVHLNIYDVNDALQKLNAPGISSMATVILTAPIEGVSKKISLEFYITECKCNADGTVDIDGEFNAVGLKQVKNEQIGTDKMTTYEFLSQLAKDLKLGFATTNKCQDIDDKRWRQVYAQTYKEFITDQLSFGGIDSQSVFDAWIDQFGYVVMVNLSYVMSENVEPEQLVMNVTKGIGMTDKKDSMGEQLYEETERMITNSKEIQTISNILFTRWSTETDNECVQKNGTANKYFYMTDIGDTNTIVTGELELIEPSVEGDDKSEEYKFDKCEFLGFEMDDDSTPVLMQKKIVQNFKTMMNYKQIFIEMERPNYYLQRGMLVNVAFQDYDAQTKNTTMFNAGNVNKGEPDEEFIEESTNLEGDDIKTLKDSLLVRGLGISNPALSGMYYINDMIFKYDDGLGIKQCMHLVKKGLKNNIINSNTSINI